MSCLIEINAFDSFYCYCSFMSCLVEMKAFDSFYFVFKLLLLLPCFVII